MQKDDIDLGPRKKFAQTQAQKLLQDSGVIEAPISLWKVIKQLQVTKNLEVQKFDFGSNISGITVTENEFEKEVVTIGFNEKHPWCRRRFSIGHEIGHLLLGHTCSKDSSDYREKEADIFSNELLIPTKFIKSDFIKTPNIETLAKLYRVSAAAMTIKLMGCRLIK
jgi:Zn-dependent peptidase ImmA (M78 family)